jgi:tripartite-type tricarboxylate transporter receptor subunit TctC
MGRGVSRCVLAAVGAILVAGIANVAAQDYPSRTVRLVAPFSAGGGADSVARLVAEKLSESFGKQVIVDNRPGASNIIGTEIVAKAPPDGYTILLAINNHAINAGLFPKLPYDPEKDFTPITLIGLNPFIVVVHPSLPVKSVQDLVKLARARPGALNYASAGNGTAAHFAAELFKLRAKVDMTHIPYKGVSQAVIDLVAGAVHVMFPSPGSAISQVKAGRLRLLAVTTSRRTRAMPDVPTVQESGVPGYEFSNWWGLLAPRGTPGNVVLRINQDVRQLLQSKDVQARLGGENGEPVGSTPEYFRDYLRTEIEKYSRLVKEIGLKPD